MRKRDHNGLRIGDRVRLKQELPGPVVRTGSPDVVAVVDRWISPVTLLGDVVIRLPDGYERLTFAHWLELA
jgi:hypothetical protein